MTTSLWNLDRVSLGDGRLRAVSLAIHPGVTAVLGHSGAGKTSLLNLLVGFEQPDTGTITAGVERGRHARPLFWVPQDGGLWPHLTAREHLAVVLGDGARRAKSEGRGANSEGRGAKSEENRPDLDAPAGDRINGLLAEFELAHRVTAMPQTLSQGERARLAVARALAADAAVLVMDEPLAHVDPARIGQFWDVIRRHLAGSATSLVFATHSPRSVLAEARRVVCLKEGGVLHTGDVAALYWQPPTAELAACFGEANWLTPDEARLWLEREETAARCFRPEQITVAAANHSPLIVEAARFQGAVAEVALRHEPTGVRRRFWHRPAMDHLERGTRVLLKALVALVLAAHLGGCKPSAQATLAVREFHTWAVPPDGTVQPAPRSVAIGGDGELIALDTAGRVLVYGPDGRVRRQWRMPDTAIGKPEGVCRLSDGRVVVCDTHYHRVVVFDGQGRVLQMFGREGPGPGEFIYPVAVARDDHDNLFVAEYGSNDRVQKFTRDGQFILAFGGFGTKPGEFQRPSGIVWHEGKVFVADAFNNRIEVFTDDGRFVGILEVPDQRVAWQFPYDLRLGVDGALYVIEYGAARLTKLSLAGRLLGRYGTPGAGIGQFATPWGVAVDPQGRVFVADTGNRRLVEVTTD